MQARNRRLARWNITQQFVDVIFKASQISLVLSPSISLIINACARRPGSPDRHLDSVSINSLSAYTMAKRPFSLSVEIVANPIPQTVYSIAAPLLNLFTNVIHRLILENGN